MIWTRQRILLVSLLLAAVGAGAVVVAFQTETPAPAPLASFAPPGALLAIESPDFATLLKTWTGSAEEKRWLAGDDYAAFSRSRLFDRLGQAQSQFAATAGLPPDAQFLQSIAGDRSLLAWYDIGNLQFLYITHLPSGQAAKTPLLALRDKFEERKAGDATFYVRSQTDADSGQTRTVAFAVRGDDLLLATREDLLAGALALMQHPADRTLASDAWYSATVAAAGQPASEPSPDLRMTLNLAAIVRSPYFRSYWIQQNVTEMKQYTAALSDLYRTPGSLREERVLLAANPDTVPIGTDLSPVLDYLPSNTGVYRAVSQPSVDEVLHQMDDKLLSRRPSAYRDTTSAPAADLSTPAAGDDASFEQTIDEPLVIAQPASAALAPLRALLSAAQPSAILTYSTAASANDYAGDTLFHPIHAAVVLESASSWSAAAVEQSLTAVLSPRLSVNGAGLTWTQHNDAGGIWIELSGLRGLDLAVRDRICIVASDPETLSQLLTAAHSSAHTQQSALVVAGFSASSERAEFTRLTRLLDRAGVTAPPAPGTPPLFFSGNMASLSAAFQDLDAETFTETSTPDRAIHQAVLYQWRR